MYATEKENEKGGMGIIPQTLVRCLTSNLHYCIFSLVCYNKDNKRKENKKMRKKNKFNPYDLKITEKIEEVRNAKFTLENCVNKVITKKGVIDLYPEGPDKEKAKKDFENAQYSFLCAIGNYDARLQELKNYEKENEGKITIYVSKFMNSHDLIELFYQNYGRR